MTDEDLRRLKFVSSRTPSPDALEVFVPNGTTPDAELQQLESGTAQTRWYPVEGGHRVLILYDGGPYNTQRFSLARGAWDHEHCTRCGSPIEAMAECWVPESDEYIALDEECHAELFGPERAQNVENDFISIEGPVERVGNDLMIRIPLGEGGEELASSADGVGEVRDGCLCVVIEPWLAQNLHVRAGSDARDA